MRGKGRVIIFLREDTRGHNLQMSKEPVEPECFNPLQNMMHFGVEVNFSFSRVTSQAKW